MTVREYVSEAEGLRDRVERLERRVRDFEDREAIHRLFLQLQSATDRRDRIAYAACFTDDGEWSGISGRAVGRQAIDDFMGRVFVPWESEARRTYHSVSDIAIDLDGDMATARAQYRHIFPNADGGPVMVHFGHFDAVFHRTSDGWRFKRRAGYVDLPYHEPKYQLGDSAGAPPQR